uniref:Mitochondrial carrier protein n=1 Tax=Parastrongyloides trichosuri TaxID=131310 RepID=A0A0N4ZU62_PARTI
MDLDALYVNSVSGAFGATGAAIVGLPFDTVKTRLQASQKGEFKSPLDCLKKTISHEGVKGLFRGAIPIITASAPTYSFHYVVNQQTVAFFANGKKENLPIWKELICGGIAGASICGILTPGERLKCYMQVRTDKISVYKALKNVVSTDGLLSLFKGFNATLLREVPMGAGYYATYNILRNQITEDNKRPPLWKVLIVGSLAGACGWTCGMPGDVIKSRIQSSIGSKSNTKILVVAKELYKTNGLRGFFIGYLPVLLRSMPVNAVFFAFCETAKSLIFNQT